MSETSYKQIVKSSGIYGISQVINVILGVIRSKLTAILLGTTGVGLIGVFQSIIDLVRSVSSLGLETSATKEVAQLNASTEGEALGKKLFGIRVWFYITAILGALLCVIFSKTISLWVFDSANYTIHIALLSIAVFFTTLSSACIAFLQGFRRIPYMAYSGVLGSIFGLLAIIPIYYFWGIKGIVPVFIISSIISFGFNLIFYHRLPFKFIKTSLKDVIERGKPMIRLGGYIVAAGLLGAVSLFVVRGYIIKEWNLEEAGLFQAAWAINGVVWGVILRSANADFFPNLCATVKDKTQAQTLVNKQTLLLLLIISPILIGLTAYAEFVVRILYSSEFLGSVGTLRWHIIGAFLKIAITPLATVLLAKGKGGLHLLCELIYWITYILICYYLLPTMGIKATGIAYLGAYIVYLPAVGIVTHRISRIRWNLQIISILIANFIFIGLLYYLVHYHHKNIALFGGVLFCITTMYSLFVLREISKKKKRF